MAESNLHFLGLTKNNFSITLKNKQMKKQISIIAMLLISISAISQTWSAVGSGQTDPVVAFYRHSSGKLFISNSQLPSTVKTWNGTTYGTYGPSYNSQFSSMCEYDTNLIQCSSGLVRSGGNSAWSNLCGGPATMGTHSDSINGRLYYISSNNTTLRYWNGGTTTYSVSGFTAGFIANLSADKPNNQMFVCGHFTYNNIANTTLVKFIPPTTWNIIPNTGLTMSAGSAANSALNYNGNLYMVGTFGTGGGPTMHGQLNKWNGTTWTTLWSHSNVSSGTGAWKLTECYGKLYFFSGGSQSGDTTNILEYDGNTVHSIGYTIGGGFVLSDIEAYHNELYVGGSFTSISGVSFNHIAKYSPNAPLTVSPTMINGDSCFAGNNGSATCTVSGGLPSAYTYLWSNGSTNDTVSGLIAGTYTVTVSDGYVSNSSTVLITQPSPVSAAQNQINLSCNGIHDGSAFIVASGGTPSYTYFWNNGSTNDSISGLDTGSYSCLVIDNMSCATTKWFTISQPDSFLVSKIVSNVSCNGGNNGTATYAAAGGTPSYTYLWSTGDTYSSDSSLTAGTYTCLMKDSHNCSITDTFTIAEPSTALSATYSTTNESGIGLNDGTASVFPTGGTYHYTYLWMPGGQTIQTAVGLTGGTYTCTVTDSTGCSHQYSAIVSTTDNTGISVNAFSGISIYPNPSNGQFTIDAGEATVDVFNCLGQVVSHLRINGKQTISLDEPGMYFVQVTKNGRVFNSRMINK
jgi:hypothetical protein